MKRRGRFITYDKELVLQQIVAGKLSTQEIADRHGITRDMVYSLKHAAKKRNIITDPVKRLDDILPIDKRISLEGAPREILELAKCFRDGEVSELDFYQAVQRIILT